MRKVVRLHCFLDSLLEMIHIRASRLVYWYSRRALSEAREAFHVVDERDAAALEARGELRFDFGVHCKTHHMKYKQRFIFYTRMQ